MATFAYIAKTRQGSVKKGELAARVVTMPWLLRKQNVVVSVLGGKGGKGRHPAKSEFWEWGE